MVKLRNTGSKAEGFRLRFGSYLDDFGTKVTLYHKTDVKDSMGRLTSSADTTSTIKADIQYVTKFDLMYLNSGEVEIGDGMLFIKYSININIHDEVEFNGVKWLVTKQIEGELVGGDLVYNGYFIRKND